MLKAYYLSLGSNIGDRVGYLNAATTAIAEVATLIAQSEDYTTAPWGYVQQEDFVNRCLLVRSTLAPQALLAALQAIELQLHRQRLIHWGPRTIDIDIVWAKGVSQCSETLVLPHPRAFERAFVLVPLMDLPMVDPVLERLVKRNMPLVAEQQVRKWI